MAKFTEREEVSTLSMNDILRKMQQTPMGKDKSVSLADTIPKNNSHMTNMSVSNHKWDNMNQNIHQQNDYIPSMYEDIIQQEIQKGNIVDSFDQVVNNTVTKNYQEFSNHPVKTNEGVRMGKYTVAVGVMESVGKNTKKIFNIMNERKEIIFENLFVGEAADSIVKFLNKGIPLNSQKIVEVLDLEETYVRNRQDTIRFKKLYEKSLSEKDRVSCDIYNSRYQVARANAICALEHIKSINESIR